MSVRLHILGTGRTARTLARLWDQAGVLVQIGLLDPQGLPVAGVESARKLLDESLPSNRLMARWAASEGLGL